MSAAGGAGIRDRPAEVWSRTEAALVPGGLGPGTPLAERPVVGEDLDPAALAKLRVLVLLRRHRIRRTVRRWSPWCGHGIPCRSE